MKVFEALHRDGADFSRPLRWCNFRWFQRRDKRSQFRVPNVSVFPKQQGRVGSSDATSVTLFNRQSSHIVQTIKIDVQDTRVVAAAQFPRRRDLVVVAGHLCRLPSFARQASKQFVQMPSSQG
ncbi:MAG: hypothetical protein SGI91_06520 [Alphaproteobacteria bacterium]|nr:hypothetical protein [Alphaproteobacteria bacterium]